MPSAPVPKEDMIVERWDGDVVETRGEGGPPGACHATDHATEPRDEMQNDDLTLMEEIMRLGGLPTG
jgi:hypothetical protein